MSFLRNSLTIHILLPVFSILSAHANPTVIVISGGNSEYENHGRYYDKIEQLMKLYPTNSWNHYHLVGDGPGSKPNSPAEEGEIPTVNAEGKVNLVRRDPPQGAVFYQAATADHIRNAFTQASKNLKPDDPVLIYISDHGSLTHEGASLVRLWKSSMTSSDLSRNISILNEGQRIVMFHEQCFGGDGVDELLGPNGKLHENGKQRNICGFSAASPGRTSSSTEQLMPLLYQSLKNPKLNATLIEPDSKKYQFQELLNQAHLNFTTNPLSSSEIFLLSYLEQHKSGPTDIATRKKCKDEGQIIGSSVVQSLEDAALVGQREYLRNWKSNISLSHAEIEKLKAKCTALSKIDVNDSSAVKGVLDKCAGELHAQSNKISQGMFKTKQEMADLYLASLSPELQ